MKNATNLIFGWLVGFLLLMIELPGYENIWAVKIVGGGFILWTFYYSFSHMSDEVNVPHDKSEEKIKRRPTTRRRIMR